MITLAHTAYVTGTDGTKWSQLVQKTVAEMFNTEIELWDSSDVTVAGGFQNQGFPFLHLQKSEKT